MSEVMTVILGVFIFILQLVNCFFITYQVIVSVTGMLFNKSPHTTILDNVLARRFAILVCAHNEENVIAQIVRNLKSVDYPSSRFDIYVICDNCSDNTAQVVREHGGIAMERHDLTKKGKGHGLGWMFSKLWEMEEEGNIYNAVVILDADNVVNKKFLTVMNNKLHQGYEVIQAYLDSKNPSDTWVTKSYAFAYWATNRIYQLARHSIGLSAQLGGTGMVFRTNVIKEMGWGATSLTEDLEFTAKYILARNKPVAWAHDAIIYDEKPLNMKASYKQRVRWMQGHFDCMFRYALPLLRESFKKLSLKHLDMAIYLIQPIRLIISGLMLMITFTSFMQWYPKELSPYIFNPYYWTIILSVYYLITILGVVLEGKWNRLQWVFWAYIFGFSWIPISIQGIFNVNKKEWTHTVHSRTLSQEEISRISV